MQKLENSPENAARREKQSGGRWLLFSFACDFWLAFWAQQRLQLADTTSDRYLCPKGQLQRFLQQNWHAFTADSIVLD